MQNKNIITQAIKRSFGLLLTTLALGLLSSAAQAATGGGRIYYSLSGPIYTMNSDGSGKAPLPAGVSGEPSRALHPDGGAVPHRWLLVARVPSGGTQGELFAVRDDGATTVQLSNDPNNPSSNNPGIAAEAGGPARWAFGDSFISYNGVNSVGEGIFHATIAFDGAGVPSLTSAPVPVLYDNFIYGFDWSPVANQLVHWHKRSGDYSPISEWELFVTTFDALGVGTTRLLANGAGCEWSPINNRIAFSYFDQFGRQGIGTISPDGTGLTTLTSGTGMKGDFSAHWSPDSGFIAFTRRTQSNQKGSSFYYYDVMRVPVSGGSAANLTADIPDSRYGPWPFTDAWR